jgi:anti-sigma factor RsiW
VSATLTCAEVRELLDPFLDAELPATMLLAVARHAGSCAVCDAEVREGSALHDAIEATLQSEAETLDLSRVWPTVAARTERVDRRRRARRLAAVPVFGAAGLALAASALLWFRAPAPVPERVASARPRPNHAVIDRLRSEAADVAVRRDRKNGTMLIMVNSSEGVR